MRPNWLPSKIVSLAVQCASREPISSAVRCHSTVSRLSRAPVCLTVQWRRRSTSKGVINEALGLMSTCGSSGLAWLDAHWGLYCVDSSQIRRRAHCWLEGNLRTTTSAHWRCKEGNLKGIRPLSAVCQRLSTERHVCRAVGMSQFGQDLSVFKKK